MEVDDVIDEVSLFTGESWKSVHAVLRLSKDFEIPYIARYRRNETGMSDPERVLTIVKCEKMVLEFRNKKEKSLQKLRSMEDGKWVRDAIAAIQDNCKTVDDIEEVMLPFKTSKKTFWDGKEECAKELESFVTGNRKDGLSDVMKRHGEDTVKEVGGRMIKGSAQFSVAVTKALETAVKVETSFYGKRQKLTEEKMKELKRNFGTYENYSSHHCQPHNVLAIERGKKEGLLKVQIEGNTQCAKEVIREMTRNLSSSQRLLYDEALSLLIKGWKISWWNKRVKEAHQHAVKEVFRRNLQSMLLRERVDGVIMGLDPGYKNGHKYAVIDETGKVMGSGVIDRDLSQRVLSVIEQYKVDVVAVGDGSNHQYALKEVAKACSGKCKFALVSEKGASVYSASKGAKKEFGSMDILLISAVSIARRLQNALELVKVPPSALGVGMYQKDVPAKLLDTELESTVKQVVSDVGLDLNTASTELLEKIPGIGSKRAEDIVAYRDKHGRFESREELKKVKGVGQRVYQQCAGFLLVYGGKQKLDETVIHPDDYALAEELRKDPSLARDDEHKAFILEQLQRNKREVQNKPANLLNAVASLEDLKENETVLTATVTNVTDFGAFCFLGLERDGLIHVSKFDRSKSIYESVCVGDVVDVKVIEVDRKSKKVSLDFVREEKVTATKKKGKKESRKRLEKDKITDERKHKKSKDDYD